MKVRILKGGWTWKGAAMTVGSVIDAPSPEWVANRVADGGLVEPITEDDPPETATIEAPETATSSRASAKKRGN